MNDKLSKLKLNFAASKKDAFQCPDFAEALRGTSSDESIFEQIVDCFSNRLANYATYYCRDETLGKDAFQDAMLTALTKLETFRGDSPIEPWLPVNPVIA